MYRISTNMPNDDLRYSMGRQDFNLSQTQNQIASGRRLNNLREDPIAAAHSTRLNSRIVRMERYQRNIDHVRSTYQEAEGYMTSSLEAIQRVRELAVQGANGTYSQEEQSYIASEVNQLLNQMIDMANVTNTDGLALFGGTDSRDKPFQAHEGRIPGLTGRAVTSVDYQGNIGENMAEIEEGAKVATTFKGNDIFWAENQSLFAARDGRDYVVAEDTYFLLDGERIDLNAGDNIHNIIDRINQSTASVEAYMDPGSGGLNLKTTLPHQLWLDEPVGSNVLKDLGVLAEVGQPPMNFHQDTDISGGSLFDMVISLRDGLLQGDIEAVGSRIIRGLDQALSSNLDSLAKVGSISERMDITQSQLEKGVIDRRSYDSLLTDVDMTEAITRLKMLEYTQRAAYQASAQVLKPTLMDFLR
ncbi:MAG: flagellar hook-associated protein 3 [Spirochaetaceae bacterium]|jgi:flagellar hook-associated protein 3 FlgL|nr:flagellar hook-associated protein 3 [Spirochaetaceae bacterium]